MNTAAQQEPVEGQIVEAAPKALAKGMAKPRLAAVPDSSPAGMIIYAMSNGSSIAEIRELYALKKEWEADEARKAYNLAMTEFKKESDLVIFKRKFVGYETKDQAGNVNGRVGYSHAELSDVTEIVVPALARHGITNSWDLRQENGLVYVDCILRHSQGHSEKVSLHARPDDSGKKNGIQQVSSTVSYLERYTLLAATGLATKGMDDDGRGTSAEEPAQQRGSYTHRAGGKSKSKTDEGPPSEAVAKLVADLEAVADDGMQPLITAWGALSEESRKLVGSRFAGLKKRAETAARPS